MTETGPRAVDQDPVARTLREACAGVGDWPLPGSGRTGERLSLLREMCVRDVAVGRLVEAHADALAIAAELRFALPCASDVWGVWAAGPPERVIAERSGSGWALTGTKPWCSGAGLVDGALVTARADDGYRLFAVTMAKGGATPGPSDWVGPGMRRTDTRPVEFRSAPASPVGGPGDYLDRPGFWAGAIGVAACWHGGTVAVAEELLRVARRSSDPHLLAHLGGVHAGLQENDAVLQAAGYAIDASPTASSQERALSVRATVERNARLVIDLVGRALGPAPLAQNGRHAQLVADVSVYIRQHHGERDLEALGRLVAERCGPEG